jgi:hypothetical protein
MLKRFVKYTFNSLPFRLISHVESDRHTILILGNVLLELHYAFYYETAAARIQKILKRFLAHR